MIPLLLAAVAVSTSSTATTAPAAQPAKVAEPAEDGPILDIEGAELVENTPRAARPQTSTVAEGRPEVDRTDVFASLTDKVTGIIDRTTLGGYGEHWFEAGDNRVARFRAHRYILFVYSQISDRISTATEIEFEFAGSPNKRDGILGFGEVLLEFSVVDFTITDWLILRAGVILIPVGAFNVRHDAPTRDLTTRPIAYTTIVPSTWFESGAGLLGTFEIGDTQSLSYELYAVNGFDARIFDGFGLRAARGSHFEDNNHDKALVGRLGYSPFLGLEIGLSGYTGAYDRQQNRVNMANVDLTWRLGKLEVLGEAVYVAIDEGFVEGFSDGSAANTRDAVPEGMFGFYLQGNYHFGIPGLWEMLPDWLAQATMTGVIRYEGKDTNVNIGSRIGDQRRLSLGLNFRPIEPYVIKTEFQFDAFGVDQGKSAPEVFQPRFWEDVSIGFVSSIAYLF